MTNWTGDRQNQVLGLVKLNSDMALVFYYPKPNRYSINTLAGAIEETPEFGELSMYFVESERDLFTGLKTITGKHRKVVVGLSFFTPQLWETAALISRLKKEYGNAIFLIAGGPHPTGDPEGTLGLGVDVVVRGEGEETLVELLGKFGREEDYTSVKGIVYMEKRGGIRFTGLRRPVNLNKYPPFTIKHRLFSPIEITRGCPYLCSFCQTGHIFGPQPRHRSIENILGYVRLLTERGLTDIKFITPNAFSYGSPDGKTINVNKLEALLRGVRAIIGNRGRIFMGSFPSEVRPEHVTEETVNLVRKYANNDNLIIGAQSGSQRILDLCHRGHKVEDIFRAVDITVRAGLVANVDFIFGLPGEEPADVKQTIQVIKELVERGARVHAHTFMPLPQTAFAKKPAGRISKELENLINILNASHKVYGHWREQEKLAEKIARYLTGGCL
ncbi:radical SAM protein [Thermincola ferriacetica]|uniref:Radical SAM protein n=1 Tax=Thermincola ferriacetica TaxID=281456 RepID=A0A0L6W0M9_9FIRM|nr:TIGR04013 family B12-binding domain/radical SAM domain-containing protein [Thermincola ferriacetica]KNZ69021.1 radical SAM protein [Thermincola ferriacetica]